MKTYPYHTPNGIIELVEKREYDKLQAASVELTRWQALARQLAQALATCQGFIEDAHIIEAQWDWEPIKEAKTALAAYESAKSGDFKPCENCQSDLVCSDLGKCGGSA